MEATEHPKPEEQQPQPQQPPLEESGATAPGKNISNKKNMENFGENSTKLFITFS